MTPDAPFFAEAVALLERLIATPSLSRQEDGTAALLHDFFSRKGLEPRREGHNVWAVAPDFDPTRPTLLLNSHHDTVPPCAGWQRAPFAPTREGDRLYGLGSNDAGGPLVALIAAFLAAARWPHRPFNLIVAATAEEEVSGSGGISSVLDRLSPNGTLPDAAIVGEPTRMAMAVAERGLFVVDAEAEGVAGHAARDEGRNAIYEALADIEWIRSYRFPKASDLLGPVKMTVTQIEAGTRHNVVPDRCRFVVDVRTNDCYTNEEVLAVMQRHCRSRLVPRSLRLQPSHIAADHPLVLAAQRLGIARFGSPTLSDQALLPLPSVKMGPGDSARSHTADEYICLSEIADGIATYLELLRALCALWPQAAGRHQHTQS